MSNHVFPSGGADGGCRLHPSHYNPEPRRIFFRSSLVAAGVLALLLAVACSSSPAVQKYQAISTCNATAQSLTRAFGVLYQTHKAENPALWGDRYEKARAAYESYQKVALAAADALEAGGDTALLLAAVNEALSQLTILLASYGVK